MPKALGITLILIMLMVLIVVALVLWERRQWRRSVAQLTAPIVRQAAAGATPERVRLAEVQTLPPPVKRYFHHVLQDGQPIIKTVRLHQDGGFRPSPEMPGWLPLRAEQYFSTAPRAFVWNATIRMGPGLPVMVCDSYRQGQGRMVGKGLALIPVINARDDERLAQAALTDSGISVSLEFAFNERGEIVSVYAPARYREVNGNDEVTPWKGHFSDYIEAAGYRIPSRGEVAWHLQETVYPYWKGELSNVQYTP